MAQFSILINMNFEIEDPNHSLNFAKGLVYNMQQTIGNKAKIELDISTLNQKYLYGSTENMD